MATEGERLATVEAVLHDLRGDVLANTQELHRVRARTHKLEGGMALLLNRDSVRADVAAERNKKMDRRWSVLLALAAVAAVIEPLISHFVTGG